MSIFARITRPALTAAVLAGLALPAAAQQIGTVASSEPTLRGTPPGVKAPALALGSGRVDEETAAS